MPLRSSSVRNALAFLSFVAATLLLPPPAALADRPQIAVTLDATIGTHEESTGRQSLPLIPAPVFEVNVPLSRFEIFAEGFPPIGPVSYAAHNPAVLRSTQLSYGFAAVRYRLRGDHFEVGIGETLYNQATTNNQMIVLNGVIGMNGQPPARVKILDNRTEIDSSRVAGARYELGYRLPLKSKGSLAFHLDFTPTMHAVVHEGTSVALSCITMPGPVCGGGFHFARSDPETGSQFDAQLRWSRPLRHLTLLYGLRYLNYAARFDRTHRLADRNTLLLPFVGAGVPLGR